MKRLVEAYAMSIKFSSSAFSSRKINLPFRSGFRTMYSYIDLYSRPEMTVGDLACPSLIAV